MSTLRIPKKKKDFTSANFTKFNEVSEPKMFVSVISQIHKTSVEMSSTDMYDSHVNTHVATLSNDNTWHSSWKV